MRHGLAPSKHSYYRCAVPARTQEWGGVMVKKQDSPGKYCPHCGVQYVESEPHWLSPEEVPHTSTIDCLRALADRLEIVERRLDNHNF